MKEINRKIEAETQEKGRDYETDELVLQYQKEPTERLFEEILADVKPVVHKLAITYSRYISSLDIEDLISEGYIVLWKSVQIFREDGGSKFTTYLYLLLKQRYIDILRTDTAQRRDYHRVSYSLDQDCGGDDWNENDRGSVKASAQNEEFDLVEMRILIEGLNLPPKQRQTMEYLLDGYDKPYIAQQLGVCTPALHSYVTRIKEKLLKDSYRLNTRGEVIEGC